MNNFDFNQVDDDCGAAEDDEELEGLDLGAGGDAGGATTTNGGVGEKTDAEKKNVRMAADVDAGDDGGCARQLVA